MLTLPNYDGTLAPYALQGTPLIPRAPRVALTRTAFAAAHVISDPLAERSPWDTRPAVDWDATLAFRVGLWDQGLGLAEAMDTAQRGMGVDWATARELITRTMRAAKAHPLAPRVACGAGTDHVALADLRDAAAITAAYETQAEVIEAAGGQLILMASRAFTAIEADESTYHTVYRHLIDGARDPVVLHWLGDMFDPALAGYWGSHDVATASDFVLRLIAENPAKVDGIKISLLNQAHEEAFRARLPALTFATTAIAAAAIAPAASQALEALALGDLPTYHRLLAPTVPLSREIFKAPTRFYKAGIAFLSWLNGTQRHFIMPAGLQSSREITHYAEVFRLADQAGLLTNPDLAQHRMATLLALHGMA